MQGRAGTCCVSWHTPCHAPPSPCCCRAAPLRSSACCPTAEPAALPSLCGRHHTTPPHPTHTLSLYKMRVMPATAAVGPLRALLLRRAPTPTTRPARHAQPLPAHSQIKRLPNCCLLLLWILQPPSYLDTLPCTALLLLLLLTRPRHGAAGGSQASNCRCSCCCRPHHRC
jgi:hypothetical protein